jgi:histidine triad (HIT) family protein
MNEATDPAPFDPLLFDPIPSEPAHLAASGCLFCQIVVGYVPADLVAENDDAVAFRDIDPQAPVHVLVVPRWHHPDVGALADHPGSLAGLVRLAAEVADAHAEGGYRLVFNTGPQGGQSVGHVHGHVLAGRTMTWPPG